MAVQKHFRLPEDVAEKIASRDREKYPTENSYVSMAIRKFSFYEEQEEIRKELLEIRNKVEEIHAFCRNGFSADSDIYGKNFSY